jgi:hypothetical protein
MAAAVTPKLFEEETILEWFARHETANFAREGERNAAYLILNGIIQRAETFCNRRFLWQDQTTEEVSPYGKRLYLSRLPVADVESVHAFVDYSFSETSIIDADAYFLERDAVVIKTGQDWQYRRYRVTYSGGYTNYGVEPTDYPSGKYSSTALPDDLAQALLTQLNFEYANRTKAGVQSITDRDGSVTWNQPYQLLPMVKEVLYSYRVEHLPQ